MFANSRSTFFYYIFRYFRILELEAALLDTEAPSASDIYAICKGQSVPTALRPDVWQACLYITDQGDQMSQFNEVYDLPEQNIIRDDCQQLVGMQKKYIMLLVNIFIFVYYIYLSHILLHFICSKARK